MEDLKDTQDLDGYALTDIFHPDPGKLLSDCEGNVSVVEGGEKSNHDSSHTVYVEIP